MLIHHLLSSEMFSPCACKTHLLSNSVHLVSSTPSPHHPPFSEALQRQYFAAQYIS